MCAAHAQPAKRWAAAEVAPTAFDGPGARAARIGVYPAQGAAAHHSGSHQGIVLERYRSVAEGALMDLFKAPSQRGKSLQTAGRCIRQNSGGLPSLKKPLGKEKLFPNPALENCNGQAFGCSLN